VSPSKRLVLRSQFPVEHLSQWPTDEHGSTRIWRAIVRHPETSNCESPPSKAGGLPGRNYSGASVWRAPWHSGRAGGSGTSSSSRRPLAAVSRCRSRATVRVSPLPHSSTSPTRPLPCASSTMARPGRRPAAQGVGDRQPASDAGGHRHSGFRGKSRIHARCHELQHTHQPPATRHQ